MNIETVENLLLHAQHDAQYIVPLCAQNMHIVDDCFNSPSPK